MKLHDTIAAIATPIGSGGIAILRLSGTDAETIAARLISQTPIARLESHKLTLCSVHETDQPDRLIDRALVVVMRAPHSYTGETVVEIHAHGGYFVAQRILEELLQSGARLAEGGEFTRRAFLNGKTDLTAAEATMDVIDSHSALGLTNAARSLNGQLAEEIADLRNRAIAVTSHISAAADYPEEVDPPEPAELLSQFAEIDDRITRLLGSFQTGKILKDGITTVILGRPNVGKSSLLNALTRSDRAIVTDIPGTTRDVIEEYVHLGGISLRLLDTAGIRDRSAADEVERIGMERSMAQIAQADLCLLLLDSTDTVTAEDKQIADAVREKQFLILLNKTDRNTAPNIDAVAAALAVDPARILQTATPKNLPPQGMEELEDAIRRMFLDGRVKPGEVYLSNTRQRDALLKASDALHHAIDGLNLGIPYDLLYVDLEDVLSALGEVVGLTIQEEIIDQVFSRFCVGK